MLFKKYFWLLKVDFLNVYTSKLCMTIYFKEKMNLIRLIKTGKKFLKKETILLPFIKN